MILVFCCCHYSIFCFLLIISLIIIDIIPFFCPTLFSRFPPCIPSPWESRNWKPMGRPSWQWLHLLWNTWLILRLWRLPTSRRRAVALVTWSWLFWDGHRVVTYGIWCELLQGHVFVFVVLHRLTHFDLGIPLSNVPVVSSRPCHGWRLDDTKKPSLPNWGDGRSRNLCLFHCCELLDQLLGSWLKSHLLVEVASWLAPATRNSILLVSTV